nr:MFS transporter [Halonotius roseus]
MSLDAGPDSRHGWLIATVGAVAMVFTFGTPLSYGIFREPFSNAFGIAPVALSTVFSVMLFTFFIGSGIVGVLSVRWPARAVLLAAAAATGLTAPALYVLDSYLGLLVVFAVLGLALGTQFVVVASVVPRWFERRRGAATGLIFVGNGLGLFVLPPIWQIAIADFGVRQGFLAIMSVTTLTFLAAGLLCRRPPWVEEASTTIGDLVGWVGGLARTRQFQYLFVGIGLAFAWYQLLAAFAVDLFASRGLSETAASTAFGLIGGVSIISRIGGGYLGDRLGSRRAFLLSLGCATAGLTLLAAPSPGLLIGSVGLIGLGLGGCATLYIPVLLTVYPPEKDTAVIGVFNVAAGVGSLVMPPLGTATIAATDGYTVAILLTAVLTLIAFGLIVAGTERPELMKRG